MPAPSHKTDYAILIGLGLAVILVFALLLGWGYLRNETGEEGGVRTTHSAGDAGTMAWYMLCERLNYKVERSEQPLRTDALRDVGVLVMINPVAPVARDERTALEAWVVAGGVLICEGGDGRLPWERNSPLFSGRQRAENWYREVTTTAGASCNLPLSRDVRSVAMTTRRVILGEGRVKDDDEEDASGERPDGACPRAHGAALSGQRGLYPFRAFAKRGLSPLPCRKRGQPPFPYSRKWVQPPFPRHAPLRRRAGLWLADRCVPVEPAHRPGGLARCWRSTWWRMRRRNRPARGTVPFAMPEKGTAPISIQPEKGTAPFFRLPLTARALSHVAGVGFRRVQFTPDLMPSDIVGVNIYNTATGEFQFRQGPIFTDIVLADEINRAPAKTQAALLEAMEERKATVDGVSHEMSHAFTVFATQNPVEFEGTYPLPEAEVDRFMLKIVVDYPSEESEAAILDRVEAGFNAADLATADVRPVLNLQRLLELHEVVRRIHMEESVRRYTTQIVRATRAIPQVSLGASPPASGIGCHGLLVNPCSRSGARLDKQAVAPSRGRHADAGGQGTCRRGRPGVRVAR